MYNIQPFNKKPKIEHVKSNGSFSLLCKNTDPFDDCFTGDELAELELVATQAEHKQNLGRGAPAQKPTEFW